ncbi:MAG TPA: neutral/alkaline non-lysosomal ceramidase N-terminal domain-containing protein, partial [Fimbriimonadaceae bacterium]|nr:neutral/alkaline non-lysosomal ceramidase N-terminal domain-containing protein [Fimbriimonadaceae bacterium]
MLIGTAQTDITPEPGCELSGFAARVQPSTGILDRLFARALYLEGGDRLQAVDRLAWIHCDLIGFDRGLAQSIRAGVGERLGLDPSRVVLSATHTHSGPCTMRLIEAGRFDEPYAGWLAPRLVELAADASQEPEFCRMREIAEPVELAFNR